MSKILGIDLGSASIGYVIRDNDESPEKQIVKKGVITFESGMQKGQSGYVSPTADRRTARGKRNLIRARKYRKWALLKVLIKNQMVPLTKDELENWSTYKKGRVNKFPENEQFLSWLKCHFSYDGCKNEYKNPYDLRVKATEEKLSKHEFGRALYHLVQRRGYKNISEKDKETEKQKEKREGEDGLEQALQKHNDILSKALKNEFLDKGKRVRNEYPFRKEYKYELEVICKKQGFDISEREKNYKK